MAANAKREGYDQPRTGDLKDSLADIARAKENIGYKPRYTLEQGLKTTVEWFTQASGMRKPVPSLFNVC